MEELGLWKSFSERVSTIYLPDRKRPMMPTILSESLCSLKAKTDKFTFVMDIYMDVSTGSILHTDYNNAIICVKKNHIYDSNELKTDKMYMDLYRNVVLMHDNQKYTKYIKTSVDVVSYLMILMNHYTANKLILYNTGIYRSTQYIENNRLPVESDLPDDIQQFLKAWNSGAGTYTKYDNRQAHSVMDIESYIHITSPIRRLVDLLNIIEVQRQIGIYDFSSDAMEFCNSWYNRLDYINQTMRDIRKVQTDCSMLELLTNNPNLNESIYDGYVFDKTVRDDGMYQYAVYINKLRLVSRITVPYDIENYSVLQFKIYIFEEEDTFRKKIRLQVFV